MISIRRSFVSFAAAALAALLAMPAQAQDEAVNEQLKDEIANQVIEELKSSGALQEAVQEGIREFIREQQEARAEAQQEQRRQANERAQNVPAVSTERDHIYGNPDAEISLVEYSDFECPYCKRFHDTARTLVDESDGQVNWVYRHFPLDMHNPGARQQAEASECAAELGGNDAFWSYTDAIYERTSSGGSGFPQEQLVPLATEVGLDEAAFRECVESGRYAERVQADFEEGRRAGVSGTPGNILLNNETGETAVAHGAQPLDKLQQAVDSLMEGG